MDRQSERAANWRAARKIQDRNLVMLALYGHPFSSYTWKALIPLYAVGAEFEFRELGPDHA